MLGTNIHLDRSTTLRQFAATQQKGNVVFFPLNNPSVTSDLQSVHSLIISPSEMASPVDVTDRVGPLSL